MPLQHILLPILVGLQLPITGILLYVPGNAPRKRGSGLTESLRPRVHEPPDSAMRFCRDTERLRRALGRSGATVGNSVRVGGDNDDAVRELFELIRSVRRRMFLSVLSIEADAVRRLLIDAMRERALACLQVRMLVDGHGSISRASPPLLELQAAGGRIARLRPLVASGTLRGAFNCRNHRRMVIADGRVGWIGGRNIAQKCLSTSADGSHWVDVSLRISGPAAAILESICRSDWLTASGEGVPDDITEPAGAGAGGC